MYALWEENMRILIEGIGFEIWKAAKNVPFVPT